MKRTFKLIFSFVMIFVLLCACTKDDALGLVISLECDSTDGVWQLEMSKQGVVDTVGEAEKNDETGEMSFVFEAVGEGETELDFYYITDGSSDIEKAVRVKKYSVSVNENFEITSKVISDEDITVPAFKLNDQASAQDYLKQELGLLDKNDGNEYIIKFIEEYTENGIKWYKFSLSQVITLDNGKTVLRFKQMYAVSETGEIVELDEGKDTPDEELNLK